MIRRLLNKKTNFIKQSLRFKRNSILWKYKVNVFDRMSDDLLFPVLEYKSFIWHFVKT